MLQQIIISKKIWMAFFLSSIFTTVRASESVRALHLMMEGLESQNLPLRMS